MIKNPILEVNWTSQWGKFKEKNLKEHGALTDMTVLRAVKRIQGEKFKDGMTWPMSPALAVKEIIGDMKYLAKNIIAVGQSNEMAPFGLYTVTYQYKDCKVTSAWIDAGNTVSCIFSIKHEEMPEFEVVYYGVNGGINRKYKLVSESREEASFEAIRRMTRNYKEWLVKPTGRTGVVI